MGSARVADEIGVEVKDGEVKDGIVTLTGWIDSYAKRWAAEDAAHRVRAVMAVANDLVVRLPSATERLDADLAAATIHALAWDAAIPTENIVSK
ncbi:MAG TPA: BON domain-containing protein [Ktedonobacterales bacterium]|nr:BON domain-containing protein [Ktedonobacterales bacterium]